MLPLPPPPIKPKQGNTLYMQKSLCETILGFSNSTCFLLSTFFPFYKTYLLSLFVSHTIAFDYPIYSICSWDLIMTLQQNYNFLEYREQAATTALINHQEVTRFLISSVLHMHLTYPHNSRRYKLLSYFTNKEIEVQEV